MMSQDDLTVRFNYALELHKLGRFSDARQKYRQILSLLPSSSAVFGLMGASLAQQELHDESIRFLARATTLDPFHAASYSNLGNAFRDIGRPQEGVLKQKKAIVLQPEFSDAYRNLGISLHQVGRYAQALSALTRSEQLNSGQAEVLTAIANTLKAMGRISEALMQDNRVVQLAPLYAEGRLNRGDTLQQLREYSQAAINHRSAIALKPDLSEAYMNLGNALFSVRLYGQAIDNLNRASGISPKLAEAYLNLGNVYLEAERYEAAEVSYLQAYKIKPTLDECLSSLIQAKAWACRWFGFSELRDELLSGICEENLIANPFTLLHLTDDPVINKIASVGFSRGKESNYSKPNYRPSVKSLRSRGERIRIGYFSSDFHDHATMHLFAEIMEKHDRSLFEIISFSFGPDVKDKWRVRAITASDRFHELSGCSDPEIIERAISEDLDIAVDLKGFTKDARFEIFTNRVAPVQVSYLGYPGTSGSSSIDYLIADRFVIPEEYIRCYTEKLVFMPNCYQSNCAKREIDLTYSSREASGLPSDGFIFCSFNTLRKLNPGTFSNWMEILRKVDNSILWMLVDDSNAMASLRQEALAHGVDGERLFFASSLPVQQHLGRITVADVFLDSFPYNAHTTASDALRGGVPVVTMAGRSFASRVAGSLLTVSDLPELITYSVEEYTALAVRMGRDSEFYNSIRNKVFNSLAHSKLFNSDAFVCALEHSFKEMTRRNRAGLSLEHLYL